ncbi:MAG: methyltransferase domain-containing protein [Desulfobacterales bacterium]|uniref:Methyltransferase domain-containing protein n=1 Tax=Candidatus Desulfatibia vada TaxID=2841696 RepID=A0A8J6TLW2_9BACT|nr:methyltransferase domain-containing protein [Candidatus Desulfatibia vada]
MIITDGANPNLHPYFLNKLACPVCLSDFLCSAVGERKEHLVCTACKNTFLISGNLPILLIQDKNWQKKADEIEGEDDYNVKKIPPKVHVERNAYINKNTEMFLKESGADLSKDETLIVGCSLAELEFFVERCKHVVSLDIVPSLAKGCLVATEERNIPAAWVCGDGECLPFENESYDTVIVRQSLHHMLKYHSAISEFFRVCKKGGHVLIIDEPFVETDLHDSPLSSLPNEFHVYGGIVLGKIREELGIQFTCTTSHGIRKWCSSIRKLLGNYRRRGCFSIKDVSFKPSELMLKANDFKDLEKEAAYIKPNTEDPETYLADKYYSFSLLQCIFALSQHTSDFQLIWPPEIAWTDESGGTVRFYHGPNPQREKPLIEKLVNTGNVSIAARKTASTAVFRDRSGLNAIPLDLARRLSYPDTKLNQLN